MKVELQRVNDRFHFKGTGSAGIAVDIDSNKEGGGDDLGARPMELVLMGLGSCSAVDIINILRKQRQQVDDVHISIDGERRQGEPPAVFTKIHVHFTLKGRIDPEKAQKAIDLSFEKYCSVHAMLEKTAVITSSFDIQ